MPTSTYIGNRPLLLVGSLVIFCFPLIQSAEKSAGLIFEDSVAPILTAHCTDCHNATTQKAELDLSSTAGLLKGGESGPVFEKGKPEKSHLYEMVHREEMPKKGGPLNHDQIQAIHDWIAGGAEFRTEPVLTEAPPSQHDIIPVMLLRCTACHGPRKQEGGVDLRTVASMKKGGENGPALIPGDPEKSLVIQRIESEACPPRKLLLKEFVKRPPKSEVETLKKWIAAGAPEIDLPADVATTEPDPLVTEEDRQHWAFIPPAEVLKADLSTLSIDQLIEAKLQKKGLSLSPEADRNTLIRRAYLDLTGLPPSLEEWRKWSTEITDDWYPRMIDHLLSSPRYGERWGRYWLDLAGYADSEGGVSADPVREVAWKYRDYVIKSFNEDKPYDRFLQEQIAGDELLDWENSEVITEEMIDNLVATGFLRMGIDQTGSRTMNFVPERLGVIGDAIAVVNSGLMGLTMECAKCHSHKYDPIPQRDYYRMKAIFQGALDEHDWLSFKTRSVDLATPEQKKRFSEINPPLESEKKKLESALGKAENDLKIKTLQAHYPDQSEADREATLVALRVAENNRTLPQKILVEKLQRAELIPDEKQPQSVQDAKSKIAALEKSIASVKDKMEPPLAVRALWDRGEPSPTFILRRGEHTKPGRMVGPGVPSALTDGRTPFEIEEPFPNGTPKTGRRLAFARWLTSPEHPLASRVMVNRIWYHHFGTGIVSTLENFGKQGERPSHPDLLDWLALTFIKENWSIKEMHRVIMNSRTYKQSSEITDERLEKDPQNRLLSRMPLRRMNAEALRDSMLYVSGKLDLQGGGPPDSVSIDRDGMVSVEPEEDGTLRRSVYLRYRRTEIPTMMDTFDYPEMGPNCLSRNVSTVSPQSLMLMNNAGIRSLASSFAGRVEKTLSGEEAGNADRVDAVYRLALSRPPDAMEAELGSQALTELEKRWNGNRHAALETYCHTILNSAAFLYID